jgi:hypothetical protein
MKAIILRYLQKYPGRWKAWAKERVTSSRRSITMKEISAKNKESGFYKGTEIAIDQLVEHVIAMK